MTAVLLDGRPLRSPLSGVGQYVQQLAVALQADPALRLGLLEFDFFGRAADFRNSLTIDRSRIDSRPHRLLHRKVFNGIAAYTSLPIAPLLGFNRFDVVHGTYFERLPAMPRGRRRPVEVTTVHDVGFLRHPDLFAPRNLAASRRALAQQLQRSTLVFTPSQFTADELVALAGADPDRVVVTPLAPTRPAEAGSLPHGVGRRPFALYLGNVDPRKNVPALVDAWIAEELGEDFDLVVAGAPLPGTEALAERLRFLGAKGIRALGYVTDSQREALFRAAACFVYPSLYEGFGLPVLEAMAAGTPVVISDAPALVEVAGDAAVVVSLAEPNALGPALRRVLADDVLRADLAARGKRRAAGFTWASTAAATAEGYARALRQG